jgi:hypothetical protein
MVHRDCRDFHVINRQSVPQAIMTIPEILWELSVCIYPIVKGFKPSPVLMRYEAAKAAR